MDSPSTEIETRQLEELIQSVEDLRRRVAALERHSLPEPLSATTPIEFAGPTASLPTGLLAAIGRLLLGVAGAYLLRAITEANFLPQLAGTLAGLLYAGAWLGSAAGIRSANRLLAAVHALTAALIAVPLLWEATVRFHSLSPEYAAVALALFIVLGQVVSWRRDLSVIAAVASLAGAGTALTLIIATLNPVPFTIALLVAAAAIEYGACHDRALAPRWIIALASDFCAFLLLYLVTLPRGVPDGYAAISVSTVIIIEIALVAIFLTSTVIRTIRRRLPISGIEVAQLAITVSLAVGSGFRLAHGPGVFAEGISCLAAGVLGYLAAFASKCIPRRNFHVFAVFAVLLVGIGGVLALPPLTRTVLWSILALAGTAIGERTHGNTLRIHGALYLAAAAYSSGLLAYSTERLIAVSNGGRAPLTAASILCAITIVAACGLVLSLRKPPVLWSERVSSALLAALLCWNATGLAAGLFGHWDVSLVSTLRTALIAAVALILAWFGPRRNLGELIWILYPWMIFGAIKLLAEDFRQGRPATLFVSLLLYGGALLVIPRLLRLETSASASAAGRSAVAKAG
jgi:hypothetical protein